MLDRVSVFLGLSTSVFRRVLFELTSRFLNLTSILDPEEKAQPDRIEAMLFNYFSPLPITANRGCESRRFRSHPTTERVVLEGRF